MSEAITEADRITGEQIEITGRALFGDQWRPRMAEAFGITRQTVYAWTSSGTKRAIFAGYLAPYIMRLRRSITEAEALITG